MVVRCSNNLNPCSATHPCRRLDRARSRSRARHALCRRTCPGQQALFFFLFFFWLEVMADKTLSSGRAVEAKQQPSYISFYSRSTGLYIYIIAVSHRCILLQANTANTAQLQYGYVWRVHGGSKYGGGGGMSSMGGQGVSELFIQTQTHHSFSIRLSPPFYGADESTKRMMQAHVVDAIDDPALRSATYRTLS